MGAYLIYLQLELKRAGKVLPRFLAGAIALAVILGAIAFSAGKVLYQDEVISRIKIGVVLPDEDILAKTAMSMLTSLESVKSVCDFEYLDETSGQEKMRAEQLHALMIVPEGFVDDIITAVNTPVTIVLPDNPGLEAMIFKELADSGARTLSVAQASIYAADELCIAYELPNEISRVEAELNRVYFAYALPREDYFRNYQVSATGDVSVMQYYAVSAVVLFLFFCGIPLAGLCEPEKPVLMQKLERSGISRELQILSRCLAVWCLLSGVAAMGAAVMAYLDLIQMKIIHVFLLLLVCLVIASMIAAVFTITDSPIVGVMALFWLTIGMLFLSGGLIPSVFLPDAIRQVRGLIPTTPLIDILKVFVKGGISAGVVIRALFWGLGWYLAAVVSGRCL